jgi:hypothetical protein
MLTVIYLLFLRISKTREGIDYPPTKAIGIKSLALDSILSFSVFAGSIYLYGYVIM